MYFYSQDLFTGAQIYDVMTLILTFDLPLKTLTLVIRPELIRHETLIFHLCLTLDKTFSLVLKCLTL